MTQEDKNIITSEINRRLKQLWFSSSMQADNDDYYRNPVVKELKRLAVFIANIKETEKPIIPNDTYEEAVKKALSWLKENAGNYWCDDFDLDCPEELLNDFREAMKRE